MDEDIHEGIDERLLWGDGAAITKEEEQELQSTGWVARGYRDDVNRCYVLERKSRVLFY